MFCIQNRTWGLESSCFGPAHQSSSRLWQVPSSFPTLLHLPLWPLRVPLSFCSQGRPCHSQALWMGGSQINCSSLVSCGGGEAGGKDQMVQIELLSQKKLGTAYVASEEGYGQGRDLEPRNHSFPPPSISHALSTDSGARDTAANQTQSFL